MLVSDSTVVIRVASVVVIIKAVLYSACTMLETLDT